MEFVVPGACDGLRVDRALALLGGLSRAQAAGLVAGGKVALDDQTVASPSSRVRADQRLRADSPPASATPPAPDPAVAVALVHVDADVIVVDKPAGLVVHPGAGHPDGTLVNGLLARFPEMAGVGDPGRPGIVHRLDGGTSGLLVVARTTAAHADLVAQLAARTVERRYLAVIWGVPDPPRGLIDAPIGRSARQATRMAVSARGRPARTRYAVLAAYDDPPAALIACRLETGRTHQIRVHLAAIGHPVVGDGAYRGARAALVAPRPLLHAVHLGFVHPRTGRTVTFGASVPVDMAGVLAHWGAAAPDPAAVAALPALFDLAALAPD